MGEESVTGGFVGILIGLLVGIMQWIFYWYYGIKAEPWLWEMHSWGQTIAYLAIIPCSFGLWALIDDFLRNVYSTQGSICKGAFGVLCGFIGAYTLICWIYASYILKILICVIICIALWIASLYFQDDLSRFLGFSP